MKRRTRISLFVAGGVFLAAAATAGALTVQSQGGYITGLETMHALRQLPRFPAAMEGKSFPCVSRDLRRGTWRSSNRMEPRSGSVWTRTTRSSVCCPEGRTPRMMTISRPTKTPRSPGK